MLIWNEVDVCRQYLQWGDFFSRPNFDVIHIWKTCLLALRLKNKLHYRAINSLWRTIIKYDHLLRNSASSTTSGVFRKGCLLFSMAEPNKLFDLIDDNSIQINHSITHLSEHDTTTPNDSRYTMQTDISKNTLWLQRKYGTWCARQNRRRMLDMRRRKTLQNHLPAVSKHSALAMNVERRHLISHTFIYFLKTQNNQLLNL